jgi:hypothetical protein
VAPHAEYRAWPVDFKIMIIADDLRSYKPGQAPAQRSSPQFIIHLWSFVIRATSDDFTVSVYRCGRLMDVARLVSSGVAQW